MEIRNYSTWNHEFRKILMETKITKEQLIAFEDDIASCFNNAMIKAPIHLYNGNEDEIIKIFRHINEDDWVMCSWRSHLPRTHLPCVDCSGRRKNPNARAWRSVWALCGGTLRPARRRLSASMTGPSATYIPCASTAYTARSTVRPVRPMSMSWASSSSIPTALPGFPRDSILTHYRPVISRIMAVGYGCHHLRHCRRML